LDAWFTAALASAPHETPFAHAITTSVVARSEWRLNHHAKGGAERECQQSSARNAAATVAICSGVESARTAASVIFANRSRRIWRCPAAAGARLGASGAAGRNHWREPLPVVGPCSPMPSGKDCRGLRFRRRGSRAWKCRVFSCGSAQCSVSCQAAGQRLWDPRSPLEFCGAS
jgi:hypothetical protein